MLKKLQYNSPVILTYTLICGAVLLLNLLTGGFTNKYIFSVYRTGLLDPMQYVRLISYVFGHANYSHFINNFTVILLVGPMLEEKYGSGRIAGIIATVAFITGVVHILLPGNTALLGASGVVFAFILLSSVTGSGKGIPLTTVIVALIYITQQVYEGVAMADNISQLTHIIGGTIGAVYGLSMKRK